jgi:hypothetical protein
MSRHQEGAGILSHLKRCEVYRQTWAKVQVIQGAFWPFRSARENADGRMPRHQERAGVLPDSSRRPVRRQETQEVLNWTSQRFSYLKERKEVKGCLESTV